MSELYTKPIPAVALPDWELLRKVPIDEHDDALVPVSLSQNIRVYPAYYKMRVVGAIPECFVRSRVFEKLIQAARTLPAGLNLVVLDGWRPIAVQQYLFDTLTNLIQRDQPSLDEMQRIAIARTLVSPASDDRNNPSPHLTGGSVDVTLCDDEGRLIDMGTAFDEASPFSWSAALEEVQSDAVVAAKQHRRVLYNAMLSAGFSNLPSEWWHYDFGNQLWSYYRDEPAAIYGVTSPDSIERLWQQQLSLTCV